MWKPTHSSLPKTNGSFTKRRAGETNSNWSLTNKNWQTDQEKPEITDYTSNCWKSLSQLCTHGWLDGLKSSTFTKLPSSQADVPMIFQVHHPGCGIPWYQAETSMVFFHFCSCKVYKAFHTHPSYCCCRVVWNPMPKLNSNILHTERVRYVIFVYWSKSNVCGIFTHLCRSYVQSTYFEFALRSTFLMVITPLACVSQWVYMGYTRIIHDNTSSQQLKHVVGPFVQASSISPEIPRIGKSGKIDENLQLQGPFFLGGYNHINPLNQLWMGQRNPINHQFGMVETQRKSWDVKTTYQLVIRISEPFTVSWKIHHLKKDVKLCGLSRGQAPVRSAPTVVTGPNHGFLLAGQRVKAGIHGSMGLCSCMYYIFAILC